VWVGDGVVLVLVRMPMQLQGAGPIN